MITGRSSRARRHAKDKPVQYAATDSSEESLSEVCHLVSPVNEYTLIFIHE